MKSMSGKMSKGGKMPNQSSGKGNARKQTYGKHGGSASGGMGSSGMKKSNEMRSDTMGVTNKNPYPNGLA